MSYVQFVGANPYVEDEPPAPPLVLWRDAPRGRRAMAFVVLPRLAAFVPALVLLGPTRALAAVVHGVPQLFAAFGGGRNILDGAAAVLASEGFLVLFALAVCKSLSLGIVSLPTDLGYAIASRSQATPEKSLVKVRATVMIGSIVLFLAWIVAWARWMF
jgi:hypothetical protein